MNEKKIIPTDYKSRMNEIMSVSWKIFISQFINNRHVINKEAPFQHHFAQIIRTVGELYSINESDLFKVDLETKLENIKGKSKYVDLTCQFDKIINCGIELKFKLKRQGAQDWGRIDSYVDIESLEIAILEKKEFDLGKFYLITDDTAYINKSKRGSGTIFCLHDGHKTIPNHELNYPNNKGRHKVFVTLKNKYTMKWEKVNNWYFLEFTIENVG
ncbi:MAG: hypothetical protein GXO88_10885 [Chlorobi bacterium]|nr:hypothetical protein [Chlorobiota bacterium]